MRGIIHSTIRIIAGILSVALLSPGVSAQGAPAPRAVVPLTAYSFGDINKGETVSFMFRIRNEGNADLLLTDFVGACGCEVVSADRSIAPGKEGLARVEVSTSSQPG